MNDEYSLLPTSEFAALVRKVIKQEKLRRPKETTILLLKDFACKVAPLDVVKKLF